MEIEKRVRHFFFPALTPRFLIRLTLVAAVAYLLFGYVLVPLHIQGASMEPTYRDGSFNFCWGLRYLLSPPKRHDVVTVRFAGKKVMLLKRVIGLEGEEVEFREGRLFVNGREIPEPYVSSPYDWNLPPRHVEKRSVYVVGDNRSMPMEQHVFGQTSLIRIVGGPLW